jgi:uncharacterized protein
MVANSIIQEICDTIVAGFQPTRIILFGSNAEGAATTDSDIDLLIVMPFEGSPIRQAAAISRHLRHTVPLDVMVRTPEYIRERLALGDHFMREIIQKGRVLYDAADNGMG